MPYTNLREIPGWEGLYSVTDDGRVWSHERTRRTHHGGLAKIKGRWLTAKPNAYGYPRVTLCTDQRRRYTMVHRLMALAFLPNPLGLETINHRNGIRHDNQLENLEWCTQADNVRHGFRNGLSPARQQHTAALAFTNNRRSKLAKLSRWLQARADAINGEPTPQPPANRPRPPQEYRSPNHPADTDRAPNGREHAARRDDAPSA